MKRLAASFALLATLAAAAHAYPIAKERELGERFVLEAGSALPMVREPVVLEYVDAIARKMVDRLDAPQPFEYRFQVVRDRQMNAFAVPGGFVYVHSGLLTRVANDSELAGVLGHEIAHVHAHHIVRQQEKSSLASYASLAGILLSAIHPAIGAAAMGTGQAVALKYQREFEQEADYLGVRFLREAGFAPHGMITFMKRISDEHRTNPIEIPPYLLSHPLSDERISNLQATIRDQERPGWREPSFELERAQTIVRALAGERADSRAWDQERGGSSPRTRALHGILLLYQGDAPAAVRTLEPVRGAGAPDVSRERGLARFRTGDVEGAIVDFRARLESEPKDAVARSYLGHALLEKGDHPGAQRELKRALAASPWLDEAEHDLGQSYGRSGNAGRGFLHLARAFELRAEVERAAAQYEKAASLLEAGSAEAEEAKEKAEKLSEMSIQRVIGRDR